MRLRRLLKALSRWSALVFLFPHRYVEPSKTWEGFGMWDWSAGSYEWTRDPPWLDYVQDPHYTVAAARGDCDDYALVAATWAKSCGREGVGLAVMGYWKGPIPVPAHMIAYDAERTYSSGVIREGSPTDLVEADDRYTWVWCRDL